MRLLVPLWTFHRAAGREFPGGLGARSGLPNPPWRRQSSPVQFRRAIEADLEREFGVWSAAQIELHNRRGVAWPTLPYDPTGRWATIQRHLLTHDGEHAFVAEDRARIAGFTAAMVRDGCWFLSAFFVGPRYQGRAIGRHLLELTWGGPYRRRVTITEAIQPASTGDSACVAPPPARRRCCPPDLGQPDPVGPPDPAH